MIRINITLLMKQAFKFFGISGIGWLMDMIIFIILTSVINISEVLSNIISSGIAITFVYIISTRKMFVNRKNSINLKQKYVIYIIYQIIIILISSFIIGLLSIAISKVNIESIMNFSKILSKIVVTPITMITNFIFMKFLIEKI